MDKTKTETQASMVAGLTATWHEDLDLISAEQWDGLLAGVEGGSPFLKHAWLWALTQSACASPATGWHPRFLTLVDEQGVIQAACPLYLKDHSYGEYVFDWSWADAYNRQLAQGGSGYYPKLLSGVPFSPIPGPRLLVHAAQPRSMQQALQARLLDEMRQACRQNGWSSAHVLFLPEPQAELARSQGWLIRQGVQFHWQNRAEPFQDFEDFLSDMHRDKRKKIKQERRKVQDAGVRFRVLEGEQITQVDWDFFYRCYAQTYLERGQQPYLTRALWATVAQALPSSWVLIVAEEGSTLGNQPIACALLAVDRDQRIAYGRYWGAVKQVSCLHFEACYYQPLEWCIANGFQRFEGGAQGEHKLARGLLGVNTYSAHWLAHEGFRDAVDHFLQRESAGISHYLDELEERGPFKVQQTDQG